MVIENLVPYPINDLNINYIYQGIEVLWKKWYCVKIMPSYNVGLSYNVGNVLDEYLNFNINFYRDEDYISNNISQTQIIQLINLF